MKVFRGDLKNKTVLDAALSEGDSDIKIKGKSVPLHARGAQRVPGS